MSAKVTAEQVKEFTEAFALFDTDGSGKLSSHELGVVMRALGQHPSEEDVAEMIKAVDKDGNGQIDLDEFIAMMSSSKKDLITEEEIKEAFMLFDLDGDGVTTAAELRTAMTSLGETLTDEEVDELLKIVDTNGDGNIDYKEFYRLMMAK